MLRTAGVPDADIVVIPHEETAAILVRVPGTDAAARPILFSAHMDVVDARPEDWQRSPFTLVEENGYFFGPGVLDNKTGVTSLVSTILRLRASGQRPRNTLVFAFIGDEETTFGTTRLVARHAWVRNARYAINSDAGGGMLAERPAARLSRQGAEKTFASFRLTVTNPGGHSSRPRDDNAIYDLSRALLRIEAYRFPATANELTRAYLGTLGRIVPGPAGRCSPASPPIRRMRRRRRRCAARPNSSARPGPPASPPCSTPVMPRMRCPSAPRPSSTAASSPVSSRGGADALVEAIGNEAVRVEFDGRSAAEPRLGARPAVMRSSPPRSIGAIPACRSAPIWNPAARTA